VQTYSYVGMEGGAENASSASPVKSLASQVPPEESFEMSTFHVKKR
jgi:hypothetical protein